ncbi:MAG: anti-sigma factor family protein [Candidatus Acidiferrales bacterium]
MKCEDVSKELMAYVDGRAKSGERRGIEEHLAGCAVCRTRAEEFRKVWTVLEEAPAIEPSFGFDARLRQRIGAEPRQAGFFSIFARPRLALSMALLAALLVVVVKLPLGNPVAQPVSATVQQEDFNAIKNLGVLENYDVVTKLGALSDLAPTADDSQPQGQQAGSDGGGA